MNILALNGSPRKKGNTSRILARLGARCREAGHHWKEIPLSRLTIHACVGCGTCGRTGKCVFRDDMLPLYHDLEQADRIIIASPIYFYGLTAQAKLCIDRCQALWSRKYILHQAPKRLGRRGYLVSVAATRGPRLFAGAILTARYGLDAMDAEYDGELLYAGVDGAGAITKHPDFPRAADVLATRILDPS